MKFIKSIKILLLAFALAVGAGVASTAYASENVAQDVTTERSILAELNNNAGLNAQAIGVSCLDGVVTLRGSVESSLERTLAERIASNIEGVTEVKNLITTTK